MPVEKITKSLVDKAAPDIGKDSIFYRDSTLQGFGLRVRRNGSKTYIVEGWLPGKGKSIRYTIGKHGKITSEEARRQATIILAEMAQGINPNEKKRIAVAEQKTQATKGKSLRELWSEYKELKNLGEKTAYDNEGILKRCFSELLERPATSIDSEIVISYWQRLNAHKGPRSNKEGSRAQADRAMRILRALFNYAVARYPDAFPSNPITKAFTVIQWNKPIRRQTIVQDHDLASWYREVQALNNKTISDFLLFLVFTGLRRSEAAGLKWDEIDLKAKTLTVSASRSKNGEEHRLPLSDYLFQMLICRQETSNSDFVFPGVNPAKPIAEPKRQIAKVVEKSGVGFSCHDLRRTFITISERLAIPYCTQKKLINHKSNDVTGGYIVVKVEDMRIPMQMITNHLKAHAHIT